MKYVKGLDRSAGNNVTTSKVEHVFSKLIQSLDY